MLFRLKMIPAALMLVLSAAAAQANPPDATPTLTPDSTLPLRQTSLTSRGMAAIGNAANRLGSSIDTGVHTLGSGMHRVTNQATALIQNAISVIGVPYRRGGTSVETGFDCSGFVRAMVQQTVGKLLPRRAADQAAATQTIDKTELQPGDLVFFNTLGNRAYSHVGIYMGDDKFIHAPSRGESVRIENMNRSYWQKHFNGARRVLSSGASDANISFASNTLASADVPPSLIVPPSALPGTVATDTVAAPPALRGDIAHDAAADIHVAEATAPNSASVGNTAPASTLPTATAPEPVPAPVTVAPEPAGAQHHAQKRAHHTTTAQRGHAKKHASKTSGAKKQGKKTAQHAHGTNKKKKKSRLT